MDRELLIREAEDVDRGAIIALCREVHRETRSARNREEFQDENWLWQNWNEFPGSGQFTIAEAEEGVCGAFPMPARRMSFNGRPVKSGVIQSLVTGKLYRRRGAFTKMGRYSLENAPSYDIELCYSFPNKRSIKGFTHNLGFQLVAALPVYIKPHLLPWVLTRIRKAFSKIGRVGGARIRARTQMVEDKRTISVEEFDVRFQRLWERARSSHKNSLIRDSGYLNWRFKQQFPPPYYILASIAGEEVEAYVVYRFARVLGLPVCVIMDFISREDTLSSLTALIHLVEESARSEGTVVTLTAFQAKHPYVLAFRKAGFVAVPSRLNIRPLHLVATLTSSRLRKEDLMDSSDWFVTLADWDVL